MNDYIVAAVERVLTWDLPDEAIAQAVRSEAGHLARLDQEHVSEVDLD